MISYSSCISSLEKALEWQKALAAGLNFATKRDGIYLYNSVNSYPTEKLMVEGSTWGLIFYFCLGISTFVDINLLLHPVFGCWI